MPFTLEDEGRSVSPRSSPGLVENDEELLRIVYEPEHMHNGKLTPAAIPSTDLKCRGFSTDRFLYKDEEIMRRRAGLQMARMPDQRQSKKISRFRCGDMRRIEIESGSRKMIVVDEIDEDEIPINIAHASIYCVARLSKSAIRELKFEMLKHMQGIYSFQEIFEAND